MRDFHPEVVWVEMPSLGPDAAGYTGIAEARHAVESWIGMWSEYGFEVARYVDAGDRVVVLARERAHGGVSGAAVARELAGILTLRDGKVVRVQLYGSWAVALKDAGLQE